MDATQNESPRRADHVREARAWLAGSERPDVPPTLAGTIADIAQVHATLALVEQQRIANTLAALSLGATALEDEPIKADAVDRTRARITRRNALRAAVREGLGL